MKSGAYQPHHISNTTILSLQIWFPGPLWLTLRSKPSLSHRSCWCLHEEAILFVKCPLHSGSFSLWSLQALLLVLQWSSEQHSAPESQMPHPERASAAIREQAKIKIHCMHHANGCSNTVVWFMQHKQLVAPLHVSWNLSTIVGFIRMSHARYDNIYVMWHDNKIVNTFWFPRKHIQHDTDFNS